MARNYRGEYDNYHAKPEQKKRRAGRNAARSKLMQSGRVRKGNGKETRLITAVAICVCSQNVQIDHVILYWGVQDALF